MASMSTGGERPDKRNGAGGLRRKKRRIPVRIDMTPMVDIAFLLLIFYMVTTVFSQPQALEMNLPPDGERRKVKQLLTIRIDENNDFYWNMKKDEPVPMAEDSLRALMINKSQEFEILSILLIINPKADFNSMIHVLDEFDIIEHSFNIALSSKLGVPFTDFTNPQHPRYGDYADERFSFRYTIAPWEDSDDRRIEKVNSLINNKQGGEL